MVLFALSCRHLPTYADFRTAQMNYDHWRHYARGWLFHFFGKTDQAYAAYLLAFQHNPRDAQSARHLGAIAAQRHKYDIAEKWLLEVVQLAP